MSKKFKQNYDIRIASNGDWFHEGEKIKRFELIKLFASVLYLKKDNNYWLETPKEKGIIKVDDAPFVINKFEYSGSGKDGSCWLTTNIEERFLLSQKYQLRVDLIETDNPRPYISLDRGLDALVSRTVFYEMVNNAVKGEDGWFGIWSDKVFFHLGRT